MAARRKTWDDSYADLVAYHKKYGHCNVPQRDRKYKDLGIWVSMQRQRKEARLHRSHHKALRQDQLDRLNAIGFVWRVQRFEKQWNDKFEKLKRYKEQHGDCLVPRHYEEEPSLGFWVSNQQMLKKRGTLRPDRRDKLENLGFVWVRDNRCNWTEDRDMSKINTQWEKMYERLVEFREEHGHCMVPSFENRINPNILGHWVRRQRTVFVEGAMDETRKKRLDELGFVWKVKKNRSRIGERTESRAESNDTGHERQNSADEARDPTGPAKVPRYSVGTKVRKYFKGHGWRAGEVVSFLETHYVVKYEDGLREEQSERQLARNALSGDLENVEIGSRVSVYWPDDDQYYRATVTCQRNKKKSHYLEYDDGDCEWINLGRHEFHLLPARRKRRRAHYETGHVGTKSHAKEDLSTVDNDDAGKERKYNKRRRINETKSAESERHEGRDEESEAALESEHSIDTHADSDADSDHTWSDSDSVGAVTRLDKKVRSGHGAKGVTSADLTNVKIGSRVSVYWPDDDRYYAATVTRFKQIKRKPYFLEYDDGDREWIDLSQHRFRLLSAVETGAESSVQGNFSSSDAQQHTEYDHSARRVVSPTENLSAKRTKECRVNEEKRFSDCDSEFEWTDDECVAELVSEGSGRLAMNVDCPKDGDDVENDSVDVNCKNELHQRKECAEATKEDILKYPIGARVRKFFHRLGWFNGKVTSYDGGYYMVTYEDGDTEEYSDNEMAGIVLSPELAKVEVGSRVAVFWPEDKTYYHATVTREQNKKKPLRLEYDDGEVEWIDLRHHQFRLLPEKTRCRSEIMVDSGTEDDDSGMESCSDEEEFDE